MENKNMLSAVDIRYSYEKGNEILHGISADFASGKMTALLGPNGCGKSTLLHLLAGVMYPDSGTVAWNGQDIRTMKRRLTAQRIAIVHQNNSAPADMTVEKLVAAGRTPYRNLFRFPDAEDEKAVLEALRDTQTDVFSHKAIGTLSGGQLQRVWLAMALAQETGILLLDEITTYLDIHYQMEILHLVRTLNREKHITVILVLHDINLALEFCDEAVIMKDGKILAKGSIEEAISEDVLEDAFEVSSRLLEIEGKKICIFSRKGECYEK